MGEPTVGKLVDGLKSHSPMRIGGLLFRHIRDFTPEEGGGVPQRENPTAGTDKTGEPL